MDHDGRTVCVGCGEVACECPQRAEAFASLFRWLTKPGTRRRVELLCRLPNCGEWTIVLNAGGFVIDAQRASLAGCVMTALQEAGAT